MKSKEDHTIHLQDSLVNKHSLPATFCQIPDASLWALFRAGNKKAFDMIYERHFQLLCGYGDKICPDKALVEDVIQDLFIHLWTRRAYLGETDAIKFYLFRCLRRKLLRRMMQESRKKGVPLAPHDTDFSLALSDKTHDTSDVEEERKEVIALALLKLTDRQREAIYLKFYNNLSFQEVASVMEIEVRSVYNLIGRTIDVLRADFRKQPQATAITFLGFIFSMLGYA